MFDFLGRILDGAMDELTGGRQRQARAERAQAAINDKNAALQKEFAQNSIQWKVRDAKAAGINPLAAVGASGYQAAPSYVGADVDTSSSAMSGIAGQAIGRAIESVATKEERDFNRLMQAETLTNAKLKNEILAHQLTSIGEPVNPPMQSPTGQPSFGGQSGFKLTPAEITSSQPGAPAQEAGAINDYGFVRTSNGGYAVVPSRDVKQRTEDNLVEELHWAARNKMQPFLTGVTPPDPSRYPLPPGATHWEWQPSVQEFRPAYRRSTRGESLSTRPAPDYLKREYKGFLRKGGN